MPLERAHISAWRSLLRQPALAVWAAYVFLAPFYIFKSGLPQPGDICVLLLVPVALRGWNGRLSRNARDALRPLLWFTIWVCIVDYSWALLEGNFSIFGPDTFVLFPLYYVYNALVFLVVLVLYRRFQQRFLLVTIYVVFASILVQVLASLALRSSSLRSSLFFNNPNQLGYYALLAGTLTALTHRRLRIRLLPASLALLGCGYLALLSASRAAVGGIAILFIFMVFSNPRVIIAACVVSVGLVSFGGPVANAIDSYEERAALRHSQQGFLEERGYDRVWEHERYLVLGAGEGGFSRFDDGFHTKMELHSTPGTVLFCYGFVGAGIFLLCLWRIIRGAKLRAILMLVPPLLYTIAHQGLRFTMLWVVAAVFVVLKDEVPRRQASPISLP